MSIEFQREEILRMGEKVAAFIADYLSSMEEGELVAAELTPGDLGSQIREPLPRRGQGFDPAFRDFVDKVSANAVRIGHARFLAWVRASPLAAAVYAEALAAALNQSVAIWEGGPSATEVERLVLDWLKEMSGFHPAGVGLLTSGGSIANLTGLLAARSRLDPEVRFEGLAGKPPMTVYVTAETHISVAKAVEMMGIGRRYVKQVEMDAALRMDPADLRRKILADRAAGLRPMAVIATSGSTNTGACDDLVALGRVCRELDIWLHLDSAYGGWANMVPEKKHLVAGIEQVDSLVLDPHKGLLIPYEAGCVLVRDPKCLYQTFSAYADYLPNSHFSDPEAPFHFRDYGPQLSRGFRALKLYLAIKTYGADAFAAEVGRQYRLADEFKEMVLQDPALEMIAPVQLGTVAFRYLGNGGDGRALNELNKRLQKRLYQRRMIFLSGTQIHGKAALRVCFLSHRTKPGDLEFILEEIRAAAQEI